MKIMPIMSNYNQKTQNKNLNPAFKGYIEFASKSKTFFFNAKGADIDVINGLGQVPNQIVARKLLHPSLTMSSERSYDDLICSVRSALRDTQKDDDFTTTVHL